MKPSLTTLAAKLRGKQNYLLPLLAAALAIPFLQRDNALDSSEEDSQALSPNASESSRDLSASSLQRTTTEEASAARMDEKLSVWEAFQKASHEVQLVDAAAAELPENKGVRFFAANPRQHMTARFMDDGVRLQSGLGGDWQATVAAAAVGRGGRMTSVERAGAPSAAGETVNYEMSGVTEWYKNKPEGIEHGFTINEAPQVGAGGELRVDVSVSGLSAKNHESGIELRNAGGEPVLGYDKLKVWDATGRELPSRMTAVADTISILVADAGAVYPVTIDPVFTSYEAKLEIGELECGKPGDFLGHSVGIFGDLAAVGAPGDDSLLGTDVGAAYVFERSDTTWSIAAKLKAVDGANGDRMGGSIAVGDGFVLVGARLADLKNKPDAGAVYAFTKRMGMWMQTSKLTAKDAVSGDWFGESLAVDGDTAVIGAPNFVNNRGAAYIFARAGASWKQVTRLLAAGGVSNDRFGESVDIKGNTALVGATGQGGKGAAYVFGFNGTVWSQLQMLSDTGGATGDFFGDAVGLALDCAVVGAPGRSSSTGAAFLFTKSGMTWSSSPVQTLTAGDGAAGDMFGRSISQYGKLALIGAPGATVSSTEDRGAAYLFGPESTATWVQQSKLTAPSGVAGDWFGGSVALHQTTAVVGAFQADAPGWDGGIVVDLGCAHVFRVFSSSSPKVVIKETSNIEEEDAEDVENGDTLNFGTVLLGLNSSRVYVIRNLGNQPLLNLKAVITGGNANQFSIVKAPPSSLEPGESFEMELVFTPTSTGSKQSTLRITSNDTSAATVDVTLLGVGDDAEEPEVDDPDDQIVAVGSQARFEVRAGGSPTPSLQWRKNNAKINNKTSSVLSFRAALTDAGKYDVEAKSKGGTAISAPAYLAVVDTTETNLCLPSGGKAVMKVTAAGTNLSFTWFKGTTQIIQNSRITVSADGKTLTINDLVPGDNGLYRCAVSGPGGSLFGGIHYLTVVTGAPQMSQFSLPDGHVSCPYNFQVPFNSSSDFKPTKFTATGLPKDLVIDPMTGRITGIPAGPGGTTHSVKITAMNAKGSTVVNTSIYIHPLPCGVAGKFKGIVKRDGGLNGGFGGMIDMDINSSASISGVLTLGADKYPFTSSLSCPSQSMGAFGSITVERKGLPSLSISFHINLSTGTLTGTILDSSNTMWTFAIVAGGAFQAGSVDGMNTAARFNCPYGLTKDKFGNIYVADSANHVIRRFSPSGQVLTFAGVAGMSGLANGCESEVRFNSPLGVAADAMGFIYVADTGNRVVRKITPEGKVSTLAGSGASGVADGTGSSASFVAPTGIFVASDGAIYVTDADAHNIRKITPDGVVTTLAGKANVSGAKNGTGTAAEFYSPKGVTEVSPGILVVADTSNNCLRRIIIKTRAVTTFAGGLGVGGDADGKVVNARFWYPTGVTADAAGNVYVADTGNGTVRRVSRHGVVTTITDSCDCERPRTAGLAGDGHHENSISQEPYGCCLSCHQYSPFYQPVGIVLSGKNLVVSDCYMHVLQAGFAESACDVDFEAWRNPWGNDPYPQQSMTTMTTPYPCFNPPASSYAGTYNFILEPCDDYYDNSLTPAVLMGASIPQGNGVGMLTVNSNGTVNCTATLADGTTVTGSSILGGVYYSSSGYVPLHFMLYKNTGSVQGVHIISYNYPNDNLGHQPQTPSSPSNYVDGCMDWMKISQLPPAGKNYPEGFPLHGLQVIGEQYDSNSYANLVGSFFNSGSNNALLEFFQGGLSPEISKIFTFNANSTATMPDSSVSFSFNKANGKFSGTFKHGSPQMTTSYQGVFLRRIYSGGGFFLHDLGSLILSGQAWFGPYYSFPD